MVLKSKKRATPSSCSYKGYSPIKIIEFPTEVLLMIFSYLDIPTLLCLCNTCKCFQIIGETCLANKLKEPNISLTLLFEQEHKWNYPVDFYLDRLDLNNGKFIFKPRTIENIKFIHSSMVKKPTLYKIQIIKTQNNKIIEPLMDLNLNNLNNSFIQKHNRLPDNFIQKSYTLSTKEINNKIERTAIVYRIGHGSNHLKIPFKFTYSVTDIPPPTESINRGGERWITPKLFECYPSFFYPHEPIVHKIFMNIIHYKKEKRSRKKKRNNNHNDINNYNNNYNNHVNNDDNYNNNNEQKYKNKGKNAIRNSLDIDEQEIIHFRDENRVNNISLLQEAQEQHENMLMIRKIMDPIKSSSRWIRGVRG